MMSLIFFPLEMRYWLGRPHPTHGEDGYITTTDPEEIEANRLRLKKEDRGIWLGASLFLNHMSQMMQRSY